MDTNAIDSEDATILVSEETEFDEDLTHVGNDALMGLHLLVADDLTARLSEAFPGETYATPCLDIKLVRQAPLDLDLTGFVVTAVVSGGHGTTAKIDFDVFVNAKLDADQPTHRLMLEPRPSKGDGNAAAFAALKGDCRMHGRPWYREISEVRIDSPDGDGIGFSLANANCSFQAAFEANERATPPPIPIHA